MRDWYALKDSPDLVSSCQLAGILLLDDRRRAFQGATLLNFEVHAPARIHPFVLKECQGIVVGELVSMLLPV